MKAIVLSNMLLKGEYMKKLLVIILVVLMTTNAWAVIVTGTGMTKDEAITNGLRESVDMCAGSLIYGVTDVQNYELQKDQISASSLGYIKSYRLLQMSKIDELTVVKLDVIVSEDKIETILRNNVKLVTYDDVLKDYTNITQRQDQIKKLVEMLRILASRPVSEKYFVIYEGYKIKRIGATQVDVILNTRVGINPFYHKAYNEILKKLSDPAASSETVWTFGGKYRIEAGKLLNNRYNVSKDANPPFVDELYAQIQIDETPIDSCREYRDNLMVVFSTTKFIKGMVMILGKAFKQKVLDQEVTIDRKHNNAAIEKSQIIPPEGLPLKVEYTFTDRQVIKNLSNLKLSINACGKDVAKR